MKVGQLKMQELLASARYCIHPDMLYSYAINPSMGRVASSQGMLSYMHSCCTRQVNEKQKELSEEEEAARKALNLSIKVTLLTQWLQSELENLVKCVCHG